ncbi:MAG TPA: hypothetical protein VJM50_24005 [Pyrinomonadaceae bacterium]|nr:hypothetical protein [Pyrinomonadaceae bacterium]
MITISQVMFWVLIGASALVGFCCCWFITRTEYRRQLDAESLIVDLDDDIDRRTKNYQYLTITTPMAARIRHWRNLWSPRQ